MAKTRDRHKVGLGRKRSLFGPFSIAEDDLIDLIEREAGDLNRRVSEDQFICFVNGARSCRLPARRRRPRYPGAACPSFLRARECDQPSPEIGILLQQSPERRSLVETCPRDGGTGRLTKCPRQRILQAARAL
jgi:hypothetical protein